MSRIFTTRFFFEEKEYVSLVSVKKTEDKPVFTIRLHDEYLQEIIGGELVECKGFDGYLDKLHLRTELPQKLMICIMGAIKEHLGKSRQTPAG